MPNKIVDLDLLVPDDLELKYRGESYLVPGDIPTETVFRFTKMYRDLAEVENASDQDADQLEKMLVMVETEVLTILKIRQPTLETCPFGAVGLSAALLQILQLLGVVEVPELADAIKDPTPRRATKKKPSPRKKT